MSTTETTPKFSDLGLAPVVAKAIEEVGYEAPSQIQAEAIPPLLQRRDLLGQAQTGTGKTAAFALPLLSNLDPELRHPQALILTPTRELAIQVAEAMQTYARHMPGFHVLPVYGGQSIDIQLRKLRRGVDVVVGTPGRIQDHLRRGTLKLDKLHTVVLDEADEMLRMGFVEEVENILSHTPDEKQVALFSATMPEVVKKVATKHLRDPVEIKIQAKTATVETVAQSYWRVSGMHKLDALTRILEVEDFDAMLIFVRTKVTTVELAEKLEARGFACGALNGDMNQALRERTIERLKNGKLDIVVATDVAARGLDVDRISHVLNFDIPYDVEAYVHRIGRTGRAGRAGKAILFVSPRERRMLHTIERVTRQTIEPMRLPSRQDVADRRVNQFKQLITDTLEEQDLDFYDEIVATYRRENDLELERVAAALAYLAQRDRPLVMPKHGRQDDRPRPTPKPRPVHGQTRPTVSDRSRKRDEGHRGEAQREERPRSERPRSERPRPERTQRRPELDGVKMERYRIEVGHEHGVQPGNIVGAIAGEGDLDGHHIGHIKIHDQFSLVELPEGMPFETFQHLQNVYICGQKIRIRLDTGPGGGSDQRSEKPRAHRGKKPGVRSQRRPASAEKRTGPVDKRTGDDRKARDRKTSDHVETRERGKPGDREKPVGPGKRSGTKPKKMRTKQAILKRKAKKMRKKAEAKNAAAKNAAAKNAEKNAEKKGPVKDNA